MELQEVLKKTIEFLAAKKISSARIDAEILMAELLGWKRLDLYLKHDYPLSEEELSSYRALIKRRATGEPVAYIQGYKDFYKNKFNVMPGVLIPRPETEILVEKTIEWLRANPSQREIIDLGCGAGCIGLSICHEMPEARVTLVDISEIAVKVAKNNSRQLNVESSVRIIKQDVGDLTESFGKFDVVVANPPYIAEGDIEVDMEVSEFEPNEALYAGREGTEKIQQWASVAAKILKMRGLLIFEIGHAQADAAKAIMHDLVVFNEIEIMKDYAGRQRFIRAIRT